jgi:hypothetical protein
MPTKGQFTACVAILFDRPVSADDVATVLGRFGHVTRVEAAEAWPFSGPAAVLPYRPEVNGSLVADSVDRPWPDEMGDPKTDPKLFAAWMVGAFGPYTFPGGLTRATLQSWAWPEGKTVLHQHRAFVRLRISYVLGGSPDSPIVPADYDPTSELRFLTDAAAEVLKLPGAICLFNPSGEAIRPPALVADALRYADEDDVPPLDLWANVRMFNVDDDWVLMDTVGHSQFDVPNSDKPFPDLEAGLPPGDKYDPQEIDGFLRNVSIYMLDHGPVIREGDTIDGPGDVRWRAKVRNHGLVVPPRPTVRFFPDDGSTPPPGMLVDPETPAG